MKSKYKTKNPSILLPYQTPQTERREKNCDMTQTSDRLANLHPPPLSLICQFVIWFIAVFIKSAQSSIPPSYYVEKETLFFSCSQYLHKLFKRDHHKGQRYHEKQISLYAEYDRCNLLPFLRDSTHCPLEKVQLLTCSALLSYLYTCLICSSLVGPRDLPAETLCRGNGLSAQWVHAFGGLFIITGVMLLTNLMKGPVMSWNKSKPGAHSWSYIKYHLAHQITSVDLWIILLLHLLKLESSLIRKHSLVVLCI